MPEAVVLGTGRHVHGLLRRNALASRLRSVSRKLSEPRRPTRQQTSFDQQLDKLRAFTPRDSLSVTCNFSESYVSLAGDVRKVPNSRHAKPAEYRDADQQKTASKAVGIRDTK